MITMDLMANLYQKQRNGKPYIPSVPNEKVRQSGNLGRIALEQLVVIGLLLLPASPSLTEVPVSGRITYEMSKEDFDEVIKGASSISFCLYAFENTSTALFCEEVIGSKIVVEEERTLRKAKSVRVSASIGGNDNPIVLAAGLDLWVALSTVIRPV